MKPLHGEVKFAAEVSADSIDNPPPLYVIFCISRQDGLVAFAKGLYFDTKLAGTCSSWVHMDTIELIHKGYPK